MKLIELSMRFLNPFCTVLFIILVVLRDDWISLTGLVVCLGLSALNKVVPDSYHDADKGQEDRLKALEHKVSEIRLAIGLTKIGKDKQ